MSGVIVVTQTFGGSKVFSFPLNVADEAYIGLSIAIFIKKPLLMIRLEESDSMLTKITT